MITGKNATMVTTMAMKEVTSEVPMNKKEITKAATAKATPTA